MQNRIAAEAAFSTVPPTSSSSPLPFVNTRLPSLHPSLYTSSPYSSYDVTSTLPSKSIPSLSRQPSFDFSHLLSQTFPPLSRQTSLNTSFLPSFDEDPFAFLAFDPLESSFKAEAFDGPARVSSYDSDLSSTSEWSVGSGEDDSPPHSPQSSVTSLSDSSQSSDTELYANSEDFNSSPVLPSPYVEEQWQSHRLQRHPQGSSLSQLPLMKVEGFSVDVSSAPLSSMTVPTLPLPFTQPVYAFNYSAEEETIPTTDSSQDERRDGLRGGGNGRSPYHPNSQSAPETSDNDNDSSRDSSYDKASIPPTTSTPTTTSFADSISPKSLLLSLSASHTPASTSHSSHFSSSSPSSAVSVSSMLGGDPNEIVIGIYTRAERAAKIARYREKRANRQWKKKIMYGCRKSFADNRPRVGGRFIKMKGTEQEKQRGGK